MSAGRDLAAMVETIAAVQKDMKEFHAEHGAKLNRFYADLENVLAEIIEMKSQMLPHADYHKAIDHILGRVRAIEKHLGIADEIAA